MSVSHDEMMSVQEKLTKIREKQATMPGWSQEGGHRGHQGSLDRPRSQQSGARSDE